MADSPLTLEFWGKENKKLYLAFQELIQNSLLAGAKGGIDLLPPNVGDLVDWYKYDTLVLSYLETYRGEDLTGINETTMQRAIKVIQEWLDQALPISVLRDALKDSVFSDSRANTIAVSEVTKLFAFGNIFLWIATGAVAGKVWKTALDERVCNVCRPLHNEIAGIYQPFSIGLMSPPAHPNCRCWLSPENFLIPFLLT